MPDIKLGDEIEDVTVGLRGIAVARVEYLDGRVAWLLQPPALVNTELPQKFEIEDAYAVKVSDGVYAPKRQPMGFVARQEAQS